MNDLQNIPIAPFIEPGFYPRHVISNLAYHNGPGLSKTDLTLLDRSPAHYMAKEQMGETPAMIFGAAFHTYILEKEIFNDQYLVMEPGINRTMKAGRSLVAQAVEEQKIVLSYKDLETLKGMHDSVWAHSKAQEILSHGMAEVSGYWKDPVHPEILCKIRIDWLNTKRNILVDLKSAADARPRPWLRTAIDKKYPMQSGWYLYGVTQITRIEHRDFYFIAVEKEPPYGVMVYEADSFWIDNGLIECQQALAIYVKCLADNEWPCYPEEVQKASFPRWAQSQPIFDLA